MQQEPSLIRLDPSLALEPVFKDCQRAWPGTEFNQDTPQQRSNVKPPQRRPAFSKKRSKHHPQKEKHVQQKNARSQGREDGLIDDENQH